VFCNKTGLTKKTGLSKEHIWSKWLKTAIPSTPIHHQHTIYDRFDYSTKTIYRSPMLKTRQGSLNQRNTRNVCGRCNNGWMSTIVDRAKPFAELMIQDKPTKLDSQAQADLAAWIALTTVMYEFTDVKTAVITQAERDVIRTSGRPPASWIISIGRYSGKNWYPIRCRHHGAAFYSASPGPSTINRPPPDTLQVTTMAIGTLLINVFSSSSGDMLLAYRRFLATKSLVQLWPITSDSLDWPTGSTFADAFVDALANEFCGSIIPS
jgi:hypothetical protein